MFRGGKKQTKASGTRPKNNDMANMMGLGIPISPDDEDESSLLAELAALEGKPQPVKTGKPKKALVSMDEIDRMALSGIADVNDDDINEDDDFDENDLMSELNEIISDGEEEDPQSQRLDKPVAQPSSDISKILNERQEMYNEAIQNAKTEGASSKIRRFERGLKEIQNLIKKASKGGSITEDEIPPAVVTKTSKPINPNTQTLPPPEQPGKAVAAAPVEKFGSPTPDPEPEPRLPQPQTTTNQEAPSIDTEKLNILLERQKQFKVLALASKRENNIENARIYLATAKKFDTVIEALKEGKEVDLSNMPQLPSKTAAASPKPSEPQQQNAPPPQASPQSQASAAPSDPPLSPKTIMEALEQRLAKYQDGADKAKEEGNSGKVRRMGRIVKQYQDAIKSVKANKPVDFNELPCPPGYGPIPGVNAAADQPADPQEMAQVLANAPIDGPAPATVNVNPGPSGTRNENEYQFLVTRQKEFRRAALEAKNAGNITQAKDYLRQAKGLDPMIQAASNGMRVDVTTVPSLKRKSASSLPQQQSSTPGGGMKEEITLKGTINENYVFVETALNKQIEAATKNTEHYKLMGNLDAAKNFEMLLKNSQKDLNTLQQYKLQKAPVPKCFYMKKTFPVTKSNPHLSDSELEITIVRCLNVPLQQGYQPKDMYTYVTYEMAYPQEKPQTGTTVTKKETINPEYNAVFKALIDRKQSAFKRFCRRGVLNFKLNYVRGFLKSDKGIGQANIKLTNFSSKCEIHECVDIVDLDKGRKAVGGKIEILLRIREPFENKDTEIVNEKWLILESHLRKLDMKTPSQVPQKPSSNGYESLEVMKSEKSLFERQVVAFKGQGKQPPAGLLQKIKSREQSMLDIQNRLKQGGKQAVTDYLKNLLKAIDVEKSNAETASQKQDTQTAKNCLVKKKLLEKEVGVLRQRLGI